MKVIILGAGLTGLSAAGCLGQIDDLHIFERNSIAGGLARTEKADGFKFDYTGHFLHFNNQEIKEKILGLFEADDMLEVLRKSFIYLEKSFVPYPFQSHIHYLPEELRKDCLVGFLENLKLNKDFTEENFFNWMKNQYGSGIVKHFMLSYNKKLWTVHPKEITLDWMSRFVPRPTPEDIINGTISEGKEAEGYNATFYYPSEGIEELVKKLAKGVKFELDNNVDSVNLKDKTVKVKGKKYTYDYLISTISLKEFVLKILEEADEQLLEHATRLKCTALLNVNVGWEGGIGAEVPEGAHWLYFPEEKFDFYRVGFPSVISSKMAPAECSSCYVELSYPEGKLPEKEKYSQMENKIVEQLRNAQIIPAQAKIIKILTLPIKNSYVIYDKYWKESRNFILDYLEKRNIFSGGRYGGWEYSTMEEAIIWGEKLAEKCLKRN
jgi:protoporphyrinogen oxidase